MHSPCASADGLQLENPAEPSPLHAHRPILAESAPSMLSSTTIKAIFLEGGLSNYMTVRRSGLAQKLLEAGASLALDLRAVELRPIHKALSAVKVAEGHAWLGQGRQDGFQGCCCSQEASFTPWASHQLHTDWQACKHTPSACKR